MSASPQRLTPVPANDFRALWNDVRDDALAAYDRVGRSGWFILGHEVAEFEKALAAWWGLPFAVGCGNGMDALEIALRAGGLPIGGKVLTTPLSAFASTLAIIRAGGVPVFIDVDASGLLDLEAADEALRRDPQLRWLLPVHLYGHCLNLDKLEALCWKFQLKIVEDCAQSIGATWHGRPCGSIGIAAATSFYPTKNLGAQGDGGALLTSSKAIEQAARNLRDYGQSEKYLHTSCGLNSRLDELQAAFLRSAQLTRLTKATARRREIATRYLREIAHPNLSALAQPAGSGSVHHLFPVVVGAGMRADFLAHLKSHQVGAGIHYPILIPNQPALSGHDFIVAGPLDQALRLAEGEVSLPIHPYLTEDQVDAVIAACNSWKS